MFQNNLLLPNTPHNLATGWITTLFGTTKEHHGHVFIWKCCRSSLEVDRKCWKMPLAKHHRKIMLAFVRLFSVPFSFFPVNSLNHCFFSMFFSLSSHTLCFISNRVIPLVFHLWCIMQSDWTQSPKELSAIILGVCMYGCVFFWQKVNYFSANIWNRATCYWVSADGWESLQAFFIKYYIFSCGALFCLCFIWCFKGCSCGNNSRLSLCVLISMSEVMELYGAVSSGQIR